MKGKKIAVIGAGKDLSASIDNIKKELGEDIIIVNSPEDLKSYSKEALDGVDEEKFLENYMKLRINPILMNDYRLLDKKKSKEARVIQTIEEYLKKNNRNLVEEFRLIQEKKSELSTACRNFIINLHNG